jgi:hypothetical protein
MTVADQSKGALFYAGQMQVRKCVLTSMNSRSSIDILALLFQLEIYEDIMSPFMSGNVTIVDTYNLPTYFPVIGEEMIEFEWKTPSLDVWRKKVFYVYKMSDKMFQSDKKTAYALHFVSIEAYYDLNQRVSRSYAGNPQSIATDVFKQYLQAKEDRNDPNNTNFILGGKTPTNTIKFISNYWNPSKVISYAAANAMYTSERGGLNIPNYLFFEGNRQFYFLPIDEMMSFSPRYEYFYDQNPGADKNGFNLDRQMRTVQDIEILEPFDYLKRSMTGALSHQTFGFDILNKNWSANGNRPSGVEKTNKWWWNGPRNGTGAPNQGVYDLGGYYHNWHYWADDLKTFHTHIDDNYGVLQGDNISWNDVNAKVSTRIMNSQIHNGIIDQSAMIYNKRMSLLAQTEMTKVRITVFGRTDIEVGDCIKLNIPAMKQFGNDSSVNELKFEDVFDPFWSGKYLIMSIRHIMSGKDHMMVMDLCRDVVSKKFEYEKPTTTGAS